MKKLYRRSISGLMALLICFTTILGGGITAFAASSSGEVAKSYSIGFPRSGDANLDYSGTWGHDELHYMNGWTSGEATWMTTLHTIGSFDGPACYCIEPGVPRLLEKTYTRYGEDYWKNYPSDYNSTIDADTIKTLLGRIMQYGYQGDLSLDWRSQNESDADKMAHMMATQVLVWETVVGERDANFNHVDPGSADAVKSVYRTSHPLYYNHRDEKGCYFSINTPKTKAGEREIPMTEGVKQAFLMEREFQSQAEISSKSRVDGYDDFIFVNRYGDVQNQGNLNKALRRMMRDCNDEILEKYGADSDPVLLPQFSCHILRHTFATRLCESGANLKFIQSILGHADVSTTMNIYVDVTDALKKKEITAFDDYMTTKLET